MSNINNQKQIAISVQGATHYYKVYNEDGTVGKAIGIEGIDLDIYQGSFVALVGHNGCGKSTLAKHLNGILLPAMGKVEVFGLDTANKANIFEIRKQVGMVFQNPDNQLVATVVEEDVAFGPENLGLPREEIRRRVDEALSTVGMTEYAHHAPHKLSGGQKQRVAIAGIIAMKPDVIILDEATAMLDPIGRREVLDIIEKLNREENITIINITHYMEEAARADRVIVINDGRLCLDGSAKDIFSKVDFLHSIGLEAPQGTELIHSLISKGYRLPKDAISEDECFDAILGLVSREGYNV